MPSATTCVRCGRAVEAGDQAFYELRLAATQLARQREDRAGLQFLRQLAAERFRFRRAI